ncbi:cellobiose phosphorylase [Aerococcaceae bacterium zg-BR22]|uniref:GH36-type glycosyl hydrolase domain-containing protein n=1 Tax=Aerococcaceae bacterium zg-1292 TaxID=2774330 RepID=UPI004062AF1A|nr:cellobiose phosphorylase [Aerococcaceae bacterium zg-BR22]
MVYTRNTEKKYVVKNGETSFSFLKTGDLSQAFVGEIMINQVQGNGFDGAMNNIYLRVFDDNIKVIPLLGNASESMFLIGKKQAAWSGSFEEIEYEVRFSLADEHNWFWEVKLNGQNKTVDLIFGFDLGLANHETLRSNEAYVAQYIDHSVYNSENGYTVFSRQNQSTKANPLMQHGALNNINHYSVDGFQFFGKEYRESHFPQALLQNHLDDEIYQYEFAYISLQSERIKINGKYNFVFYGHFNPHYPTAVSGIINHSDIKDLWESVKDEELALIGLNKKNKIIGDPIETLEITDAELDNIYPRRIQEERYEGQILSFFKNTKEHVVLKRKELLVERPHGQILFTKNETTVDKPILTTTSWMDGIFNSQIAIGNTNLNKFISNSRNHLNVLKSSGQRIYVYYKNQYHLFTIPSAFEIGINYVKWIYKTKFDLFEIYNYTSSEFNMINLKIFTRSGKAYKYLISNQINMGEFENEIGFEYERDNRSVTFRCESNSFVDNIYPELSYKMDLNTSFQLNDISAYIEDYTDSTGILIFETDLTEQLEVTIQGKLEGSFSSSVEDFERAKNNFYKHFEKQTNYFCLDITNPKFKNEVEKINLIIWWYTHNMFVHYLVPHGLEQYGGAAWGTRDVSQGPVEYFSAMGNYDVVRNIIEKIYSHQFIEDGKWPQWFMFDKYNQIFSDESHGDVIVWPLKVIGDYLNATGDYSILEVNLPYMSKINRTETSVKETLLSHIEKQLDYIESNLLHDTGLSTYDDGDWNDTLQPANSKLKKYMVSSWTVELTFEAFENWLKLKALNIDLMDRIRQLKNKLHDDFNQYILSEKTVPGFIYMENINEIRYIIHPKDKESNIQYRLLPMIQGIQSEIFTKEQADFHYDLIKHELVAPDGARLMNFPTTYNGGVSKIFKRAEQAANFGREVGVMYVHAHIRYIEAIAKLGKTDEAWEALFKVNPINIKDSVPNAAIRQSNSYFSSSDANFSNRKEAQENYNKVKNGEIEVKGGWKIYSSGPGIYLNQIISNILGIKINTNDLIFNPALPKSLDGLECRMKLDDKLILFKYFSKPNDRGIYINNKKIESTEYVNKYKKTGFSVNKETVYKLCGNLENVIRINY